MKKPIAPCKDCKKRDAECHATCEDYKEYVEVNSEYAGIVKKSRMDNAPIPIVKGGKTWLK